jgi:Putative Flp pilus-assembly TadE/G-like
MIAKLLPQGRSATHENGQVLVLFALFLVVFVGFAALTIDYGSWLKARRDYQNAADSAALAGSAFLSRPISDTKKTDARKAAWASLKAQLGLSSAIDALGASSTPFDTPVTDSSYKLWVSTPPIEATTKYPGGYKDPTDRYLFVWVEKDNPAFFARIFGQDDTKVSAWATAGSFPGRFAVITLRQNGQAGPANATDIDLAGSNSALKVVDGDVGGNWGMKLNSSTNLLLPDDSQVYLTDYVSCGNSCWSSQQINSGQIPNVIKPALPLPQPVDDPSYPLPDALTALPATGGTAMVPKGPGTDAQGDITINKGAVDAAGIGCAASSPKLGPGWYHNINVQNNNCLLLDPTFNHSAPNSPSTDVSTAVPSGQRPGIYYITGALNVNQGALVVGDGVTLVFLPGGNNDGLVVGAGGVVDLNTGASDRAKGFPPDLHKAAYQTDGSYSYSWGTSGPWTYTANNADSSIVGVTVYVAKPSQYGNNVVDANTNVIKINSGGGLAWSGVTYAPHDNIQLAGQPNHDGIGQFVSWTFKFAGGTSVTQTYDGPDQSTPRLVEPHLGQ